MSLRSLWPSSLALALAAAPVLPLRAQQTTVIGIGNTVNGSSDFPAPYGNWTNGARHQMLIRASELQAAGVMAGTIHSLGFLVLSPVGAVLEDLTLRIGTTTQMSLSGTWVDGLTTVYGPTTYTDMADWNTHVFDTPFEWDGASNLVIETCFRSGTTSFNAQFRQSTTPFNSTTILANADPDICSAPSLSPFSVPQRPDMLLEWTQAPPQAAFGQSADQSCTGTVHFHDLSTNAPATWQWDLGDGTLADTPDVTHTYATSGTYTATLTVSNSFGTTSVTGDPIVVDLAGPRPIAACVPASTGTVAGFGITDVVLNGVSTPSADAATEGYADHGCLLIPATAGAPVTLDVTTGAATTHNVRAWVDWDNSGTFTNAEAVLRADHVLQADTMFVVPAFAVLDVPLRLRVIADYDFSASPQPCSAPQFGQAEDYGLLISGNTTAPVAQFTASPTVTCDGTVRFTDASLHLPTAWHWDFGDGGSSDLSSPQHTYATSGTYTVTLTASNAFGTDANTATITVDLSGQLVPASCTPATQAPCCGYGITAFTFAGIASTSGDGTEGYADRSCGNVAQVEAGHAFPIAIGTGGTNGHDVTVWIDLDNDGAFTANERVFTALNAHGPTGSVLIPGTAVPDAPLRLRVIADVIGQPLGPCDAPLFGQCEDFAVVITPNTDPPVAAFAAEPRVTCDGDVLFADASTGAPDAWAWDFGDGQTSTEASPAHHYMVPGTYDVGLTVTNANGSDTRTETAFITVLQETLCDTVRMPFFGHPVLTACEGVLTDDGGPSGNYSVGVSAQLTVAPPGATSITLTFAQFAFVPGIDFLDIYEGTDTLGFSLGAYTGTTLPPAITSATGAITLQQRAGSLQVGWAGFVATWECVTTGIAEHAVPSIGAIWPQPAQERFTVAFDRPSRPGWRLAIHNALGAKMADVALQGGLERYTFDAGPWAPGCYLITLDTDQGSRGRRLLIR